ncbi:MAG: hypothetical protein IPL39_01085 [Opitutaceae bacterium]|nr:hypothetical protein [Opitutaceae bacterium]
MNQATIRTEAVKRGAGESLLLAKRMKPAIKVFVDALRAYSPDGDDSPVASLYPIVGPIEKDTDAPEVFAEIFAFFERYPDADLGMPGPLVHLLERHIGRYEKLLIASLRRVPSSSGVNMVNRILNAHRSAEEREVLMGVLAEVAGDAKAAVSVRDEARHFIQYQNGG